MKSFYHTFTAKVQGFNFGKLHLHLSNVDRDALTELVSESEGSAALNCNILKVSIPKKHNNMYSNVVIGTKAQFSVRIADYSFENKDGNTCEGWYASLTGCILLE